ncbi:MAG: ATP-binding cassette domain-containing protein [bacterium]
MNSSVSIKNLCVSICQNRLFSDLNIELSQGQKCIITGESGTGKTTLLKCLMGFKEPDKGEIRIMDRLILPDSIWDLRTQMTLVQQEPEPGKTNVRQILSRPFSYKQNRLLSLDKEKLGQLLDSLRLSKNLLDKEIRDLSGGEKQRIALISALLLNRPILLLDEITSALDEDCTRAVIDYFKTLKNTTIIAAAHDKAMHEIADKTVTLDREYT